MIRAHGCPLTPFGMSDWVTKQCLLPLDYEESVVSSPPETGECGVQRLGDRGYSVEEVYWHRFRLSFSSRSAGVYGVVFRVQVPPKSGWEFITAGLRNSGTVNIRYIPEFRSPDGEGWKFSKVVSPSDIAITVCGRRVQGIFSGQAFSEAVRIWAVTRREQ